MLKPNSFQNIWEHVRKFFAELSFIFFLWHMLGHKHQKTSANYLECVSTCAIPTEMHSAASCLRPCGPGVQCCHVSLCRSMCIYKYIWKIRSSKHFLKHAWKMFLRQVVPSWVSDVDSQHFRKKVETSLDRANDMFTSYVFIYLYLKINMHKK